MCKQQRFIGSGVEMEDTARAVCEDNARKGQCPLETEIQNDADTDTDKVRDTE